MIRVKDLLVTFVLFLTVFSLHVCSGTPSGGVFPPEFTFRHGDWYDSWGFNRNFYGGDDGFMPNVAYESLGSDRELAYSLGERFKTNYEGLVQRATSILGYVQRWTEYGFDVDNVVMNGVHQEEWAWNADEIAHMFNENTETVAVGDCEDMAFLCATIFMAAGIDVALVLAPHHVALLIWLPEYSNANYYWDIPADGRKEGWIWVEATGDKNSLGWTPPDFADGDWITYPIGFTEFNVKFTPRYPQAEDDVTVTASVVGARASIDNVLLNYSTPDTGYNELPMEPEGSVFEAKIPKQPEGTTVTFYVSATDIEGLRKDTGAFEYTVGQGFEIPAFLLEGMILVLVFAVIIALLSRVGRT